MKRWYVIQTKSSQEASVTQELEDQGFVVFYPKYAERIFPKKLDSLPLVRSRPLFPSYIFIQLDIKQDKTWHGVRDVRGVVGFLGWSDNFLSPVREGCIEDLMLKLESDGYISLEKAVSELVSFYEGMEVRIKQGTFAGNVATYCNHSENRVTLLFSLLNRPTRLILPVDAIEVPRI